MTRTPYTIGLLQMQMSRSPQENLKKAVAMLREAAAKGVQVACLPELFMGYYFCQSEDTAVFDQAEPIPGPTTEALGKVAKELGITIMASLFERRFAGMYHNTTATIYPDGSLGGIYRKMHIPDDPLYYEKYYFTPGDLGFKTFTTPAGQKLGSLVCWDQWFPEAARLTAMQGAEVIFYPTAIGWHPAEKAEFGAAQVDAWQTVQRGHAIANGVYVAACNRIGHEDGNGMSGREERGANANQIGDGIEFFGNSFICDPYGRMLAKASHDKEEILTAVIDPAWQEQTRRWWPFFRDRRIEHYGKLTGHPDHE